MDKEKYTVFHDAFRELEHLHRARIKEILSRLELSGLEFRFFKSILPDEKLTASEISLRLDKPNSNITGLLDGLEKKGYIQRVGHPSDRRIILITYTDEGTTKQREALDTFANAVCLFLDSVPEEVFEQSLENIRYFIGKLGGVRQEPKQKEKREL